MLALDNRQCFCVLSPVEFKHTVPPARWFMDSAVQIFFSSVPIVNWGHYVVHYVEHVNLVPNWNRRESLSAIKAYGPTQRALTPEEFSLRSIPIWKPMETDMYTKGVHLFSIPDTLRAFSGTVMCILLLFCRFNHRCHKFVPEVTLSSRSACDSNFYSGLCDSLPP